MEFLDIVDTNDIVVGQASREDVYKKLLCHRIIHVLVFDDEEKMVLQKRSLQLNFCPDHWSTAAGGHVHAGETYESAALREYQEELGVTSQLELVGKDQYQTPNKHTKFLTTFKTKFNGPFHPNPQEVSEVKSFHISEIKNMIANNEKFTPELVYILEKYYS